MTIGWICLKTNRKRGSFALHPVFDACSWFYDIYTDLLENRISIGIPDDMSRELRSVFHDNLDDECDGWPEGVTWRKIYLQSVFCVRYSDAVLPRIKKDKPHKFGGYVSKRMIAAFEADEIDEIYNWLTKQEYDKLPESKQIKYSYYEWDEDDSDYQTYRTIHERISALLYWFS